MNAARNFIETVIKSRRLFGPRATAFVLLLAVPTGFGSTSASAQSATTLSVTGFNADLIYEAGKTSSSASSFDDAGNTWFEAGSFGYDGTDVLTEQKYTAGLTTGTAFTSAATDNVTGGHTSFTIQSAGTGAGPVNNALFLGNTPGTGVGEGSSSGTLTLGSTGLYTSLSIMAASTSNSGSGA